MDARLLFPKLKPFYDWVEPLTWPLIRVTVGLMIIPHGWPKLMMGVGATAQMALVKRGIAPAEPLAVVLIILETIGGLCVALGLFTRFFARASKALAANQGLYNGFVATGLGWGLVLGDAGTSIKIFFLGCVVVAGVFGGFTASRKILWVQALPGAVALALVLLA